MNLNTGVIGPDFRGADIPENHPAAGAAQDLITTCVIGGVEAESLLGSPGFDHRLHDPIGGPGLGGTWLQHQWDFEREGWNP